LSERATELRASGRKLPNHSQRQLLPITLNLGVGNWEWLGVGSWDFGVDSTLYRCSRATNRCGYEGPV
jgi:hypothetical protein